MFWRYCVNTRKRAELPEVNFGTIENFPSARWFLLDRSQARSSCFRVSVRTSCCARHSFISCPPVVHTLRGASPLYPERESARAAASPWVSLDILTVREPMGPSSLCWSPWLALYRMMLPNQRVKPSRIAQKIEILAILGIFGSVYQIVSPEA